MSRRGYLEVARESVDCASHDEIATAHERMETIIEEVLVLARAGQSIGDTERFHLEHLADRAWMNVDTEAASLSVAGDRVIVADGDRVLHLFENLFRNAVEHGSTNPASHTQQDAVEHGGSASPSGSARLPTDFCRRRRAGDPLDERESVPSTATPRPRRDPASVSRSFRRSPTATAGRFKSPRAPTAVLGSSSTPTARPGRTRRIETWSTRNSVASEERQQ